MGALLVLLLLAGMQTWIIAVDENGYIIRLAWELPVYRMGEKENDFEAYD